MYINILLYVRISVYNVQSFITKHPLNRHLYVLKFYKNYFKAVKGIKQVSESRNQNYIVSRLDLPIIKLSNDKIFFSYPFRI